MEKYIFKISLICSIFFAITLSSNLFNLEVYAYSNSEVTNINSSKRELSKSYYKEIELVSLSEINFDKTIDEKINVYKKADQESIGTTTVVDFEDLINGKITWNPDYGPIPEDSLNNKKILNSKLIDITGTPNGFIHTSSIGGKVGKTGVVIGFASPNYVERDKGLSDNETLSIDFLDNSVYYVKLDLTVTPSDSEYINNIPTKVKITAFDIEGNIINTNIKEFIGVTNNTYTPSFIEIESNNNSITKVSLETIKHPHDGIWIEKLTYKTENMIDITPPDFLIIPSKTIVTAGNRVDISIIPSEKLIETPKVMIDVEGETKKNISVSYDEFTDSYIGVYNTNETEIGQATITVEGTDEAGNLGSEEFQFIIENSISDTAKITLKSKKNMVKVGEIFDVNIMLYNVNNLKGVHLSIVYNPTIIEVVPININDEELAVEVGEVYNGSTRFINSFDNNEGELNFINFFINTDDGVNIDKNGAVLGTIRFKAKSEGKLKFFFDIDNFTTFPKIEKTVKCTLFKEPLEKTIHYEVIDSFIKIENFLGDLNNDGLVNLIDITMEAQCYGLKSNDDRFNPKYDLNSDGIIDLFDMVNIGINFLK